MAVELACRDAVADRLATVLGSVINVGPVRGDFPARNVANDPVHALHAALRDLPRFSGPDRPPVIEMLDATNEPAAAPWHTAARATLLLQPYLDELRVLPAPAAWHTVHRVAAMASAIPYLDSDLVRRHGISPIDTGSHGAIRFATAEIEARAPTSDAHYDLRPIEPVQPIPVRALSDLPEATRQLTELIAQRGAAISAAEMRAVARMLSEGLDIAASVVRDAPGLDHQRVVLAGAFESAADHLAKVFNLPMATLTQPAPAIGYLAGEISRHLRALDRLIEQAQDLETPARVAGLARASEKVLDWAAETPATVAALDTALRTAHVSANLFTHPEHESTRELGYHWIRAENPPGATEPRLLAATRAAREALNATRPTSPELSGRPIHALPEAPGSADVGFAAIRAAVQARGAVPVPPLPDHPRTRTGTRQAADLARLKARRPPGPGRNPPGQSPPTP
jgi:hypothetical protein